MHFTNAACDVRVKNGTDNIKTLSKATKEAAPLKIVNAPVIISIVSKQAKPRALIVRL